MTEFKVGDLVVVNKDRYYDPTIMLNYLNAYKKACKEKTVYEVIYVYITHIVVKRMDGKRDFLTDHIVSPVRFDLYKPKIDWIQTIKNAIGR